MTSLKKKVSRLKNVDSKLAHKILDEVVDSGPRVAFDDIGKWDMFGLILS